MKNYARQLKKLIFSLTIISFISAISNLAHAKFSEPQFDNISVEKINLNNGATISNIAIFKKNEDGTSATPVCQVSAKEFPELIPPGFDLEIREASRSTSLKSCESNLEIDILSDFSDGLDEKIVAGLPLLVFGVGCVISAAGGSYGRRMMGNETTFIKGTIATGVAAAVSTGYGYAVGGLPVTLAALTPAAPVAGMAAGSFTCIGAGALITHFFMVGF